MAIDLITSLIFILIFFAGFFLALSLAFARNLYTAKEVAFKLLQLIFGFSPAAWALLPEINWIGKILLLTFMVNSNYLVITILVSVLSTTFANVIANAHEEHQYLFALNTILAVKSDALFFYQAPLNLIEWFLAPLALVMPRPRWIRLNRYFIKVTHFPMLAAIYMFERFYLRPRAFVPQDLLLARTVSLDPTRGASLGDGMRSISGNFFGRRNRRGSELYQKNSEEILQQVFNNTHHARRQQGYGGNQPGMRGQIGGKRTNDWIAHLPENPFSPGGTSEGTPEHSKKASYFDGGPPRRPLARTPSASVSRTRRLPVTSQKQSRKARPRMESGLGGAQSDPEDFASVIGSPNIKFATPSGRPGSRRPTEDSMRDPAKRAIDFDSGDDEMDEVAVQEETDESDPEGDRSGYATVTEETVVPAQKSKTSSKPTAKQDRDTLTSEIEQGASISKARRQSIQRTNSKNIARSVPKSIRPIRDAGRRRGEEDMPNYSSSLATQLAGQHGDQSDLLSRIVMSRVDGIETAVKGGHDRVKKLEGTVLELIRELRRARQASSIDQSGRSSGSDDRKLEPKGSQ